MQTSSPDPVIPWLILGGGLHGVHMAVMLMEGLGVSASDLLIVDPEKKLLSQWKRRTGRTGMKHLRSPSVHHLDERPWSLRDFGRKETNFSHPRFIPPYNRPSLDLFNAHCDDLVEKYGLEARHLVAKALRINIETDRIRLETSVGENIDSERIVLALGMEMPLLYPAWLLEDRMGVSHVFQKEPFNVSSFQNSDSIVVGGGISAVQTALRLASDSRPVRLISRKGIRIHQFDSDPGWIGPKYMEGFEKTRCYSNRRKIIREARHRGSIPSDVHRDLIWAERQGRIQIIEKDVIAAQQDAGEWVLQLADGEVVCGDEIILATGFVDKRPGGNLIDELISRYDLPCAPCGFPVVDQALRWHSRIHVMGPLAELELGPVSRNIVGARRAVERIIEGQQEGLKIDESRSADGSVTSEPIFSLV